MRGNLNTEKKENKYDENRNVNYVVGNELLHFSTHIHTHTQH